MKRIAVVLLFLLPSLHAHAVDLELGLGKTARTTDGAYSVGFTGEIVGGWRWRVGYENLGTPNFNRTASATAAWDDIALAGGPPGTYVYTPLKRNHGVYFTAGPEWSVGGTVYSVELGLLRYNPQWIQECPAGLGASCTEAHSKRTNYTPLIGVSAARGGYVVAIEVTNVNYWGDWEDKSPTSGAYTMWLRRRF
jgi:hypothetical protein